MATAAEPINMENNGGALDKKQSIMEENETQKQIKEKKIGHRRVDSATGQTSYKKTPSSALSGAIQLGISHTVGGLSAKPERDVLLQDFQVVETMIFPKDGSNLTPAHHFDDFRFKTYAPVAFRYFRDLFGIRPADYMLSISNEPLTELSNPGASGSLFFVTHDDEFIVKTVQHKEAEFLQKLLPGYYMNLVQNPRTLLPKFYGLYCIQASGKNIRVVVMNNLLPRHIKMHLKFDLKGSTFKRKASKHERSKTSPTFKDLDLISDLPEGILMEQEIYNALIKTMQRDCLVLQSFKIMDYSMLLAIHYTDKEEEERKKKVYSSQQRLDGEVGTSHGTGESSSSSEGEAEGRKRHTLYSTPTDAIMSSTILRNKYNTDLDLWSGGIPAQSPKGERLLIFCGIIDILQCYKFKKKLEHTFKAMVYDADSVSVHRPGFYCDRFQKFMCTNVFKKIPTKTQASKRNIQKAHTLGGGVSPYRSKATTSSPRTTSERKLQSDRPDLLPNESPKPRTSQSDKTAFDDYDGINKMQLDETNDLPDNDATHSTPPDLQPRTEQPRSSYTASPQKQTTFPASNTPPASTPPLKPKEVKLVMNRQRHHVFETSV